jgi:hypothetical protein
MVSEISIMAWNTGESNNLDSIAEEIRAKDPDLVLLNELSNFDGPLGWLFGGGVNQTSEIARLADFRYYNWINVADKNAGFVGHKSVAILSRFPLGEPRKHQIIYQGSETGFGILESTLFINNMEHHVFSMRFSPIHSNKPDASPEDVWREREENIAAHYQAIAYLHTLPPGHPVIFGGDFNYEEAYHPQFQRFKYESGLEEAIVLRPDAIFFRGPGYQSVDPEHQPRGGDPSDHPWIYVTLKSSESAACLDLYARIDAIGRKLNELRASMGHVGVDWDPHNATDVADFREMQETIRQLQLQRDDLRVQAASIDCNGYADNADLNRVESECVQFLDQLDRLARQIVQLRQSMGHVGVDWDPHNATDVADFRAKQAAVKQLENQRDKIHAEAKAKGCIDY